MSTTQNKSTKTMNKNATPGGVLSLLFCNCLFCSVNLPSFSTATCYPGSGFLAVVRHRFSLLLKTVTIQQHAAVSYGIIFCTV